MSARKETILQEGSGYSGDEEWPPMEDLLHSVSFFYGPKLKARGLELKLVGTQKHRRKLVVLGAGLTRELENEMKTYLTGFSYGYSKGESAAERSRYSNSSW